MAIQGHVFWGEWKADEVYLYRPTIDHWPRICTWGCGSPCVGWTCRVYMYCTACCHLKLMDTSQEVILETGRALTPGVYRAVSLQVCTTEEILIQVWTPINSVTFQLKWQTAFRPTTDDTRRNWATVIMLLILSFSSLACLLFHSYSSLVPVLKGEFSDHGGRFLQAGCLSCHSTNSIRSNWQYLSVC